MSEECSHRNVDCNCLSVKVKNLESENEALKKELASNGEWQTRYEREYQKHRQYELKMEKELMECKEMLTAEMGRSADLQARIDAMTFMSSNELKDEIAELKSKLAEFDAACDERMKRNLERQDGLETEIERLESKLDEAVRLIEVLSENMATNYYDQVVEKFMESIRQSDGGNEEGKP